MSVASKPANRNYGKGAAVKQKPLSEVEVQAQQRQYELLGDDFRRIRECEVARPFSSLQDVAERLIPFHILAAYDGAEADFEETPDASGANLMCSRKEAWQDMCLNKAVEFTRKTEQIKKQVEIVEAAYFQGTARTEEAYLLDLFLSQDSQARSFPPAGL